MPRLAEVLEELDRGLQAQGYPPLDEPSLRVVAQHLNHPDIMQGLQSGKITTQQILQEVGQAMQAQHPTNVPGFAQEGGLINDRSGQGSVALKRGGYQVRP